MDQQTANWDHGLQHAALTDVGLRRANNQDSLAVVIAGSEDAWRRRGHLFSIADGMGAHAAGELASKLATDVLPQSYVKLLDTPAEDAIVTATQQANDQIHKRGQADPAFRGMGTTMTSLLLLPEGALVAHVGDSRAYRLRGDRYEQLTFDHSLVWEMRAAGQIPEGEVPDYIPKNIITRSLGPNPTVQVDLEGPFPVAHGDIFLLCSDGLSGPVKDKEMGAILSSMPPSEAVRALVDLANLRGGPDNITVIVVRATGPAASENVPSEPGPPAGRAVHPFAWALLGISLLAAAALAWIGRWPIALICMIGAVVAALVAVVQRFGGVPIGPPSDGRPFGKGPHTACDGAADREFLEEIEEIVSQLRDAAAEENWTVDWNRVNTLRQQGADAKEAADYARSVREYFRAIRFMMDQLKEQRGFGGDRLEDW